MAPTPLTSYSPSDPRWALVVRVADSSYFRKGPKLRAFLLYVCENTLLGRLENVREQLIGSEVFGRPPEYNISSDNIVRVEARELRRRLEAYFNGEGRDEPVTIEIPKGGYVPVFKPRDGPPQTRDPVETDGDRPADEAGTDHQLRSRSRAAPLLAAGLIVTTVAAALALHDNWRLRHNPGASGLKASDFSFYPELLGSLGAEPGRQALLVLSNPKTLIYFAADSKAPVADAPGRIALAPKELKSTFGPILKPPDRELAYQFLYLNVEDYTGMGEALAAFHLGQLMRVLNRPVRPSQARFLNWGQVQKQDLIVLGGPASNDWTYQSDAKSNFSMIGAAIHNAKPLPGEQSDYQADTVMKPLSATTDYGILKMLTSPYGFKTFMIAGISSAGTAGVAEFFATPENMKGVYDRIRAATPGKPFPSDWEVLLRIVVRDSVPVATTAIALRPALVSAR